MVAVAAGRGAAPAGGAEAETGMGAAITPGRAKASRAICSARSFSNYGDMEGDSFSFEKTNVCR